jgi:hypothetical protein
MSFEAINLAKDLLAAQKIGNFDAVIKIAGALKNLEKKENSEWRGRNSDSLQEFIANITVAKTDAEWKQVLEAGYKLFYIDSPIASSTKIKLEKKVFTDVQIFAIFGKKGHKFSRAEIAERLNIKSDRVPYILKPYIGKEITKEGELKSTKYFLTK